MSYTVFVTRSAKQDLQKSARFYDEKGEDLGDKFLDEFLEKVSYLEDNPNMFAEVGHGFRRAIMYRFGHNIFYEVFENDRVVHIHTIMHHSCDPKRWQIRFG